MGTLMAIWQYELVFVPDQVIPVVARGAGQPFSLEDRELVRLIDSILSRRDSWSEDILIWGEEGGNRIHAVIENGRIVEITARIDARNIDAQFVQKIAALARTCRCHISSADCDAVNPEVGAIMNLLKGSDACRFVSDPENFFRE